MTQTWRDRLLLFALAVMVNGSVAALVSQPGYVDAYYYFNGGQIIANGRPLTEPYIWNYAYAAGSLPVPAFGFWQPLPSLLAALGIAALRFLPPFDAAQVVFVLLAAIIPVLAYHVASRLGERRHALLAGLLAVFSGFYVIVWSLPESFTPFALCGAASLLLAGEGMARRRRREWLIAGVFAALSHLARADGLLLIGIVVIMALLIRLPARARLMFAGLALAGYVVTISPWLLRNFAVFGGLQPPGGLNALWLMEYNDLFNYPQNVTPARYFAAGWNAILAVKWDALVTNTTSFVAVVNLIFLTPLTLIGLWRRWRNDRLKPALWYGVALFAAMTFAFSLVGARGGYFHSAGALIPFVFSAAALGLDDILHWAVARRGWNFHASSRFFGASLIVMAALLTGYLIMLRIVGLPLSGEVAYNTADAVYAEIGAELARLDVPPDAPVMSNNSPGFYYFTGHGGVPLPNGDEATLLQAADDYGVSYLVVDHNVPDGLVSLFKHGPVSRRLELIQVYGSDSAATYLYRIQPQGP